jgi:bifunctional non-homologous end joining protein LigD
MGAVELVLPQGARTAALPARLSPELATLVDKPQPGHWIYEIKFDGYRMLARIASSKDIRIFTRRGNDWTSRFPALVQELRSANLPPGWYDGEIVVLDAQGRPNFNALQLAIEGGANDEIVFYLFDVPFIAGHDLRAVPLEERRAVLASVLVESKRLRFSQEIAASASAILKSACELGLEGVIGKRRGSHYSSRRSPDWIKLKCTQRQEFVIGGFTWPDEARSDPGIGSLLVGQWGSGGKLHYSGKVGAGYTMALSAQLRARLESIAQKKRPFAQSTGHDTHATWVRPDLVCEVAYNEWPEGGSLRHASFKGLREPADKPASEVVREAAKPVSNTRIRFTHGDKVIDRSTGLTKMDLLRYYAQVAEWMLPHLRGRPAYVTRFPEGIGGLRIFQQHPEGVRGFRGTEPALWPGHEPAIAFDSVEDLAAAVQMDMIEVHTWNSTARDILHPDRIVFDIDPGDRVGWDEICEGAVLVKMTLEDLGLRSWVKTTGSKGLHVVVPLAPRFDYPTVRGFSEVLVQRLARMLPERFVAKSGASNRVGRIFIDYLRNGQSQSTAEAFSARARPGMGVSMPLSWDDLVRIDSAAQWTIANAIDHLQSRKRDPWAHYWQVQQSLVAAIEALT